MLSMYSDGFRLLWHYPEFRVVCGLFRSMLLASIGVLVAVLLLHVLFMLGRNSPLYRRRSPRLGWNKRFFPAIAALTLVLGGIFWLTGKWIAHVS